MQRFIDILRDKPGAAVTDADIYVYSGTSATLATVYDGAGNAVAQPLTTNSAGVIVNGSASADPLDALGFEAPAGRYRIKAIKGSDEFELPDIELGALETAEAAATKAAVQFSSYTYAVDDSAVADVVTATLSPAPAAYAAGLRALVKVANTNTGAATLNLNSLGAVAVKLLDGSDPYAGACQAGGVYELLHDGTSFLLLNPSPFSGVGEYVFVQSDIAGAREPQPSSHYIRLAAGLTGVGDYNEGKLISESVSGSSPTIDATAVIDDATSPLNGQTVRLVETERRFFRPGSAGTLEDGDVGPHTHPLKVNGATDPVATTDGSGHLGSGSAALGRRSDPSVPVNLTNAITTSSGSESRPRNIGVAVYMRIK